MIHIIPNISCARRQFHTDLYYNSTPFFGGVAQDTLYTTLCDRLVQHGCSDNISKQTIKQYDAGFFLWFVPPFRSKRLILFESYLDFVDKYNVNCPECLSTISLQLLKEIEI